MVFDSGIDLLFPPRCAVCDGLLKLGERGICEECKDKLPLVEEPRCFRCGKHIEEPEEEYCGDCRKREHRFRRGFPLYHYVPPVSDALAAMKYHGRAEYAAFYGGRLAETYGELWKELGIKCLVPVPVHPGRLRKRGYNQAKLLAEAIAGATGIPMRNDLLRRIKATTAQKKLSREKRSLNLCRAFQPGESSAPDRVLLVDDIYTTGATADACAGVLLGMGAAEVYVTTVCCQ